MGRQRVSRGKRTSLAVIAATGALVASSVSAQALEGPVVSAAGVHALAALPTAALATRTIRTRFGTTVPKNGLSLAKAVARQRSRFGPLGVVRLFYSGFPAPWTTILPAVGRTPVSVSFKIAPSRVLSGADDGALRRWFRHAPANRRTFWTYYHEPEDNIGAGQFTALQFRAAWKHIARIATATTAASDAKLRATMILMCWTANPHSGRNWRAYIPLGYVSVLGWDCYNAGARKGKYEYPSKVLDDALALSTRLHIPWAVTELGSVIVSGDHGTGRANWLTRVARFADEKGARFVTYFDSDVGVDYRLMDRPSIRAWAASAPL